MALKINNFNFNQLTYLKIGLPDLQAFLRWEMDLSTYFPIPPLYWYSEPACKTMIHVRI